MELHPKWKLSVSENSQELDSDIILWWIKREYSVWLDELFISDFESILSFNHSEFVRVWCFTYSLIQEILRCVIDSELTNVYNGIDELP